MKKKLVLFISAFTLVTTSLFAQADLGSMTGKYFAADGLEFQNMMKIVKKQKKILV